MKKYIFNSLLAVALAAGFLASCSDDEEDGPSISLSETEVTASAGDEVSVTVTTKTPAGFQSLVVTKLWDGVAVDGEVETFTEALDEDYVYTVVEEDADHVVTLNFTVTDENNDTASKELVIAIELTARQILLKYNWKHTEEFWIKENKNDIADAYTDDVYRFNADGTFNKSVGEKDDGFNDLVTSFCYYDLNDNTVRLLMSRRDFWNNVDIVDTLDIVVIDETKLQADITLYGLDQLDTGEEEVPHGPVEEYQRRFVAVAKTSSFDPYKAGTADDAGPGACVPLTFENGRIRGKK